MSRRHAFAAQLAASFHSLKAYWAGMRKGTV
jgi:hypothetical protein